VSRELSEACQTIRDGYLKPIRFVHDLVAAADQGQVLLTGYWLDRARSILDPNRRQTLAPGSDDAR